MISARQRFTMRGRRNLKDFNFPLRGGKSFTTAQRQVMKKMRNKKRRQWKGVPSI